MSDLSGAEELWAIDNATTHPTFYAGFVVRADRVVEAAPILKRWIMLRDFVIVEDLCRRKRWTLMCPTLPQRLVIELPDVPRLRRAP